MKRFLAIIISVVILLVSLCGCRETPIEIEDHKWKMLTVQYETAGAVVACRGELLNIYTSATVIYISIEAQDGVLTVTDYTADEPVVYSGTYVLDESAYNSGGIGVSTSRYTITIGDMSGTAVVTERPKLFSDYISMQLSFDGYFINCEPLKD